MRDVGNDCLLSGDGTDFQIAMGYSKPFWSYKFKKSGLWYEVGLCILTGDICWWSGPYAPGKWNDLSIFRDSLQLMLKPGEWCETDRGYQGSAQPMSNVQVFCWQTQTLQKYRHGFGAGRRLSTSGSRIGRFLKPHTVTTCWNTKQFLVPLSFSPSSLLRPTLCFW